MSGVERQLVQLGDTRSAAAQALTLRDFPGARMGYLAVRAMLAARFGEAHVHVAEIDELLGGIARAEGDRASAREAFERARVTFLASGDARATSLGTLLAHLDPLDSETLARRPSLHAHHQGRSWRVENDLFFFGRGIERVHLYIPSAMVSRVHARVLWEVGGDDDGRWVFEDCASENGSTFAGERIERRPIHDGDEFALGTREITVRFTVETTAQLQVASE